MKMTVSDRRIFSAFMTSSIRVPITGQPYRTLFNPNPPAGEREELMEPLNEVGLSDPNRPGPNDFLFILDRFLIKKTTPEAAPSVLRHLCKALYRRSRTGSLLNYRRRSNLPSLSFSCC